MNDPLPPAPVIGPGRDKNGLPVSWVTHLHDAEAMERNIANGLAYQKTGDANAAQAYLESEIALAEMIGRHLIETHGLQPGGPPIPIVWIPDGGVLMKQGLEQAFAKAGIETLAVPCNGYERRQRHTVPKEAIVAAQRCGTLVIADGVIKTGESIVPLLNSLYQYKGDIVLAANRVYQEEALNAEKGFRYLAEGKNLPHLPPKHIRLYTAHIGDKTHDPVDNGDLVRTLGAKTEFASLLMKRKPPAHFR